MYQRLDFAFFEDHIPANINDNEYYNFDLSSIVFTEPPGAICFLILILYLLSQKKQVFIIPPKAADVRNYLYRIDFFNRLKNQVIFEEGLDYPDNYRRHDRSTFTEILEISKEDEVGHLVEKIDYQLEHTFNKQRELRSRFCAATTELFQNIPQHSQLGNETSGFIQLQSYRNNKLYLAIGDMGIGIRNSLLSNAELLHKYSTDIDAIHATMFEGVSRKGGAKGTGIFTATQNIINLGGGRITIRSGCGLITVFSKFSSQPFRRQCKFFPGTQILIRIE